jgi:hypothetical protein
LILPMSLVCSAMLVGQLGCQSGANALVCALLAWLLLSGDLLKRFRTADSGHRLHVSTAVHSQKAVILKSTREERFRDYCVFRPVNRTNTQ